MKTREHIAQEIVEVCHRVAAQRFVTAMDGNISARLPNGNILCTPTSLNKGFVTAEDLVEVTLEGKQISGTRKPSSEMDMHLFIYNNRTDVNAVVHCHPPYATGFAVARIPMTECVLPEVIVGLGAIPLAEYATPSTKEVGESLAPYMKNADAILLANHGAVTYGNDVWCAYFRMEKLEHTAHILFVAHTLGGVKTLSAGEIEKLRTVSIQNYGKDFSNKIACEVLPRKESDEEIELTQSEYQHIIEEVQRQLNQHHHK